VSPAFRHRLRVRYAECDRQGHVFNSHYFAYFDVVLTELWRAALGYYDVMTERGVDVVVGEAQARYLRAAHFDDEIDIEAGIERLGRTGITTRFRVLRDGELLVDGRLRHVCVEAAALTSTPIPDWLRDALAPWVVPLPALTGDQHGAGAGGDPPAHNPMIAGTGAG
jgi:acyl-CoA thioester hydrolase